MFYGIKNPRFFASRGILYPNQKESFVLLFFSSWEGVVEAFVFKTKM